jgi:hypothetical protein
LGKPGKLLGGGLKIVCVLKQAINCFKIQIMTIIIALPATYESDTLLDAFLSFFILT